MYGSLCVGGCCLCHYFGGLLLPQTSDPWTTTNGSIATSEKLRKKTHLNTWIWRVRFSNPFYQRRQENLCYEYLNIYIYIFICKCAVDRNVSVMINKQKEKAHYLCFSYNWQKTKKRRWILQIFNPVLCPFSFVTEIENGSFQILITTLTTNTRQKTSGQNERHQKSWARSNLPDWNLHY